MQRSTTTQRLPWLLGLTVVYVATGKLGLTLDPVGGFATLVWAPSGIALAALVRGGSGLWPAVAVGAFVTNVWVGAPWHAALGIALGNTLEAVVGAALLTHSGAREGSVARLRVAFGLIAAALLSTVASATIGVASLRLAHLVEGAVIQRTWIAWWLGDVLGDLVIAPLLLGWTAPTQVRHERSRLEAATLALVTVCCAALAFSAGPGVPLRQPYLIFLPLIWAATRFGSRVAVVAVAFSAAMAIGFAVHDLGPFASSTLAASLLELQAFMGFVAAATLFLGAASDERLAAVMDAQRALRMRDEFLAIASHELKTPLAALTLMIEGLCRDEAAPPDERRTSPARAERARVQVARLTRLVEELLDVSRLTAGQLHLHRERFDLSEAVSDLVARMHEQAARVGCVLSVVAADPVVGRWDRLRVEQVLSNLLSNAFKYGAGRPVEIAVEANGTLAIVRVRDRGVGIDSSDIPRIFDRFERAAGATRQKGLGLGLYIAQQVVSAHGGTIRVESTSGEGSTFTVELPVTVRTPMPPLGGAPKREQSAAA